VEVVASLSQGRTAVAQCGLFTHKSVPVIFEPPCSCISLVTYMIINNKIILSLWLNYAVYVFLSLNRTAIVSNPPFYTSYKCVCYI